jgi:hypothetical protein
MSIASGPPSQGGYSPQQANPSEQVTTGTTWSLGGNGTAGSQNTLGFTAGVQFTNQTTVTYQALETNDGRLYFRIESFEVLEPQSELPNPLASREP